MTNKIKIEKVKINLEIDKVRLFDEKNSLVAKREELRTEIVVLNAVNILIRGYQDPFLKPIRNKFKVKRPPLFDSLKENFQRFFTEIRYYQGFYQQNLSFDSDKVQNTIINIIENISK